MRVLGPSAEVEQRDGARLWSAPSSARGACVAFIGSRPDCSAKRERPGRQAAPRWPLILRRSIRDFHRNVTTSRSCPATRRASNAHFDALCSISSTGRRAARGTMMRMELSIWSAGPIADLPLLTCRLVDSCEAQKRQPRSHREHLQERRWAPGGCVGNRCGLTLGTDLSKWKQWLVCRLYGFLDR